MQTRLREYIRTNDLLQRGDRVLLTVSGGIDSVVMVHLFAEAGFHCAIAHANFQLRGDDSEADEAFVRDLAGRLEMPVYVRRFDVPAEMESRGISLHSTGMSASMISLTCFSTSASCSGFTFSPCEKSKRSRSGVMLDPLWYT